MKQLTKNLIIFVAIFFNVTIAVAQPTIEPNDLYEYCKTERMLIEANEKPYVQIRISPTEAEAAGRCGGYISGVLNEDLYIEVDDNLSMNELISIFINFMDNHPELKKSKGSYLSTAQIIARAVSLSGKAKCFNENAPGYFGKCPTDEELIKSIKNNKLVGHSWGTQK